MTVDRARRAREPKRPAPPPECSSPQARGAGATDPFFDLALESRESLPGVGARRSREETGLDVGYRRAGLLRCTFAGDRGRRSRSTVDRWQRGAACRSKRLASGDAPPASSGTRCRPTVRARDRSSRTRRRSTPRRADRAVSARGGAAGASGSRSGRRPLGVARSKAGVCRGVETGRRPIFAPARSSTPRARGPRFDPACRAGAGRPRPRPDRASCAPRARPLSTVVCSDEVYLVPRADGTVAARLDGRARRVSQGRDRGGRREAHRRGRAGSFRPLDPAQLRVGLVGPAARALRTGCPSSARRRSAVSSSPPATSGTASCLRPSRRWRWRTCSTGRGAATSRRSRSRGSPGARVRLEPTGRMTRTGFR